ncbi:MAG: hypothetical protein ABI824_13740 [Acidobacteriota bacterium]
MKVRFSGKRIDKHGGFIMNAGGTVAVRGVLTSPAWGQEPVATWPGAYPVKDATGYKLYDLEIAEDATGTFKSLILYRFAGFDLPTFTQLTDIQHAAYKAASVVMQVDLPVVVSQITQDDNALAGLNQVFDKVIELEAPDRFVITYSGHGDPADFMGGIVTMRSAERFVQHVRASLGISPPLILDFSTNCDVGFWDFAVFFYRHADYLISTEKPYGGAAVDAALTINHAYATIWQNSQPTLQAFDAMVAARQNQWSVERANYIAAKAEESFVVYDLHQFDSFMRALVNSPGFTVNQVVMASSDIGQYVLLAGQTALTQAFALFQIRYVSTAICSHGRPRRGDLVFSRRMC